MLCIVSHKQNSIAVFLFTVLLCFSPTLVAASDTRIWGVGFDRIELIDPMGGKMKASVWYPSEEQSGTIELGPFTFPGTWNAEPAKVIAGWVVLSHGTGGSDLGHRNLGVALAQAGIVAIAPLYPRNNFRDNSGLGHRIVWEGRPQQLNALLHHFSVESNFSSILENNPLGLFGFSLGGYTVISLLTGGHDLDWFIKHCTEHLESDPVCKFGGKDIRQAMQIVLEEEYQTPLLELVSPSVCASVLADPMMAPVSDLLLNNYPDISTLLYLPSVENQISAVHHGERFQQFSTRSGRQKSVEFRFVENAQHFSFLAPFPPQLAASLPLLANDPPGFDRAKFQKRFAVEIVEFFASEFSKCGK